MWFSIVMLFLASLFFPAYFMIELGRKRQSKLACFGWFLVATSYTLYIWNVGRWDWVGYYFRYALIAFWLYSVVRAVRNNRNVPLWPPRSFVSWAGPALSAVFAALFVFLGAYALTGHRASEETVDLRFPLRGGTYDVAHGGSRTIVNYHHEYLPQQYALDIVKLNAGGWRTNGIYPNELQAYAIYGDTLYSPCNGKVLEAVDGFEDRAPTLSEKLPEGVLPAGNHVAIGCLDAKVYIAHMQKGSVKVKVGDSVDVNTPLGLVGNSGNTSEPHLHIHAERNGEGVPITFNGEFLARNGLIRQ
ncbi:M23 family metallopeptidase [Paenibacillus elgii]|nr:M23 family metallopeptidase [Paenibacillus elgii]